MHGYGLGLRRSEVAALEITDYDAHAGTLAVHGKGDKPRVGYVLEQVMVALDAWVEARGDWDGPLFPPLIKGGRISRRIMTPEGLALIIRKRATEAGVDHFSLHDIRRTFITDLLTAGADLSVVQKLAGHRQLSTTLIYDMRGESAKIEAAKLITIPH